MKKTGLFPIICGRYNGTGVIRLWIWSIPLGLFMAKKRIWLKPIGRQWPALIPIDEGRIRDNYIWIRDAQKE